MEFTAGSRRARLVPFRDAGAALDLRARVFRAGAPDGDGHDPAARHLLLEEDGRLVGCARITLQVGAAAGVGYTAQHYDLRRFTARFPRTLEVGRVCLAPDAEGPTPARLLLAALTRVAIADRVAAVFGCASLPADGTGLARLRGCGVRFAPMPPARCPAPPSSGMSGPLPPLLRTYLALGAMVSDEAVADPDLGTLHVFAALPVAAVRRARIRRLAALLQPAGSRPIDPDRGAT